MEFETVMAINSDNASVRVDVCSDCVQEVLPRLESDVDLRYHKLAAFAADFPDRARQAVLARHNEFLNHRNKWGIANQCFLCATTTFNVEYKDSLNVKRYFETFNSVTKLCLVCNEYFHTNLDVTVPYPAWAKDSAFKDMLPMFE